MKHLMTSVAAAVLLAACGGSENQTNSAKDMVEVAETIAESISPRTGDPSEAAAALTALSLNTSGAGRISFADSATDGATATFSDVTITVEDGETPILAEKLILQGLETGEDGEANFGRMLMENLKVVPDDDDKKDADSEITIASVELINPTPETAAWVASLFADGTPDEFPMGATLGFDSWTISDLAGAIEEDGDSGTFGINKIAMTGLKDEKVGTGTVSGLNFDMVDSDGSPVKINLDSLSFAGADLKFISALQEAGDDEDEMAAALMDVIYDDPMDPGIDAMTLSNLTANIAGANFAMPSMDYLVTRNADGDPTALELKPFTATLTADPDGGEAGSELAGALGMIGYETVELSGAGKSNYDAENDIVSYTADNNYLTLKDGFTLSYGGKMEGYSAYSKSLAQAMESEGFANNSPDQFMQDALGKLTIHGFELSFEDDSFVDRMFNLAAAQSGEDPQQMRNQLVSMMAMAPMMAAGAGVDMEIATEASTALSSFIADPQTLTIKVDPEEPLNIGQMIEAGDPAAITKSSLGFSASNE